MRPGAKSHALMVGPRGLLAGVLLRALEDVREGNGHAEGAAAWIQSNRDDYPLTFIRVCEWLDLSPGAVRRAVREEGNDSIAG